uniref:Uncharacterized protein n=1 Tax=Gasterosteus aculeatus aculeatus TaxID=481459 RepID=A0AAQ4S1T8_GASAC
MTAGNEWTGVDRSTGCYANECRCQTTGFTPVVSSSLSTAWCTARHTVSSRMSNSSEPLISKGTQDAPRYVSSPPLAAPPGDTVFCVLTLQMLFSFGVLCASFSGGKEGRTNKWLYVSSLLTFSGFAVALSICKSFSRRHPWNIVGWVVVTVSLSHMVGTIASFLDLNHVFITVGVLMVIAVAIVAFSAKTHHHDVWDGLLMTLTVDVVAFAFLHLLLPRHL